MSSKQDTDFENAVKTMMLHVGENPEREGLLETPSRVRKAYEFIYGGYKENPKEILEKALFTSSNDEMVLIKDIEFYSTCEHHLLPIIGRVHVAYIPDGKVVGLSKIPRVVNVFARRMQIQEQLTEQIADAIMESIAPKGVAVVVVARHMCMEMRGVEKINSTTTSSALRGLFKKDEKTRSEFFSLINSPSGTRY
ncbi:MAG: GTP cyclohydrolase I FolE [Epsilonproteobacteria bacterium]|nr:GTP cyclohydrolase I FolE [Campylobacterota bacterium]PIP10962.1 MAG: GTP cyclohydrolase I FolE [Sulfurimonas sp. CG23_combo_of_CG06-09_8_20_14_all_36_33]PIS25705.1 MAG: GTP cyclohydrolase I FolE [Sulfurimonas sp. CG08_land_8_20_14_0_20_36_33]PIU34811.1 MAG: GTP cyclohydrolase I FolE [Sulfurimonas sp. CG07_land_8_20_14_0_80_36_56]PIV05662.1 MAG: GTP cyclohydrolase I FolE [Sulfurimonas sp. CG03_land_8_20_14_0_80_36_25]PIV35073.1 MAG: GTP cyclohydrolase I FolE [Sulfurimonas sp. CG02_land_8_20